MERVCYRCGARVGTAERIGRRDACLQCGSDLHCCRNCAFHDRAYNNACRETQAERQVDKEAGNFCEYFAFRTAVAPAAGAGARPDPKARLEALFQKRK